MSLASDYWGYPNIVDAKSEYFCVFCRRGLLLPKQLSCGHRICSICLEKLKPNKHFHGLVQCPARERENCEDSLLDEVFIDRSAERDMRDILVYCPNKSKGCKETIKYSQLQEHMKECLYSCSLRSLEPNSGARSQISGRAVIEPGILQCKFSQMGCPEQFRSRSELTEHESDVESHLMVFTRNYDQLVSENFHLRSCVRLMRKRLRTSEDHYQKLLRDHRGLLEVICTLQEMATQLEMDTHNKSYPSSMNSFELQEETRKELIQHDRTIAEQDTELENVRFRLKRAEVTGFDGILVWKIKDYSSKKREQGRTLSSPAFYTSRYGYKMACQAYLDGDGIGKGTHVSLFFTLLKGDYDSILPWPFSKRVTFILVDQNQTKKDVVYSFAPDSKSISFRRPTEAVNLPFGRPHFVSHAALESADETYLKRDTIYIKAVVGDEQVRPGPTARATE